MSAVVIDCSVTLSWLFEDEEDAGATALLRELPETRAVAPAIWPLEVANGLALSERRRRTTLKDTITFLAMLAGLPITVDHRAVGFAFGPILEVARRYDITTYDAAYLELALREHLPLASLDRRLLDAAKRAAVPTR